jgi:hypothetical protein
VVTPLFVVFITIGGTDILFELDSIPAVFGVTDQAYIVFAANAFALLGLRALFFLVTGLLDRLVYLSSGLALILAFTGVKLILHWGHGNLSTEATIRNENPPTGTENPPTGTETVDPVCCAWPATWPSSSTCCSPTLSCPACSATRSPPRSARCPPACPSCTCPATPSPSSTSRALSTRTPTTRNTLHGAGPADPGTPGPRQLPPA